MFRRPLRWGRAPLAVLLLALVVTFLPTGTASASTSSADLERDVVALVNVERAKAGLGSVRVRADIVTVARSHSQTMARQERLHHNPTFSSQITGWSRLSENVGVGPSVSSIHRALMNSDGHRRNILDDRATEIGVGVVVRNGRIWVTQNYRRPTGTVTAFPRTSQVFGDVEAGSTHAAAIERVAAAGIAPPCGLARFCPAGPVTRAEFASMLVRALDLDRPTSSTSRFRDVSGEAARDAEALAAAGLTHGCTADRFCPDNRLNREQLATFFARALELEPQPSPFRDVRATHAGSVGALAARGIVNGCTTTRYCPGDQVTRAQTASMIDRELR